MTHWMTSTYIAAKYGVSEQEVLSWTQLKAVTYTHINHTLLIDYDSVQSYLESQQILANKQAIKERLIRDEDKIIQQELEKYDESALLIRLQSECFPLYALLIKVLSALIPNIQERRLFRAITEGRSIKRIPKYNGMSDEDAFKIYLELIRKLHKELKNRLLFLKLSGKSLKTALANENREMHELEQQCNLWKSKYQLLEVELCERNKQKEAWLEQKAVMRAENIALRERILQINAMICDTENKMKDPEMASENSFPSCIPPQEECCSRHSSWARVLDFIYNIKDVVMHKWQ